MTQTPSKSTRGLIYPLYNFFHFLGKPDFKRVSTSWQIIIGVLFLLLFTEIIQVFFIKLIRGTFPSVLENSIYHGDDGVLSISLGVLLTIFFFGPFLEEVRFRLWQSTKNRLFCGSFALFLYSILDKRVGAILNLDTFESPYRTILLSALFLGLCWLLAYMVLFIWSRDEDDFGKFMEKHPSMFICGSSLLFAAIHTSNYIDTSLNTLALRILDTSPIFISGLTYSYLRIRFGFTYCVVAHMANNILGVLTPTFLL